MATKQKEESKSAEFLLAEFEALQNRALALEQVKANRINYFMILTSAAVAGVAALFNTLSNFEYFSFIISGAALLLAVIGLITLDYSLNDSVTIVFFLRMAGRVRRYFVDKDKDLFQYVAFEPNDDRPRIRAEGVSFRGSERILLIINCVSASSCITAVLIQFSPWFVYLPIAILLVLIFWFLQLIFIKKKLISAQKNTSTLVRFESA